MARLYFEKQSVHYQSMKAIVAANCRVTIPKAIRDRLGIEPGTVLEFTAEEGKMVAVKSRRDDAISRWRGKGRLPAGVSVDEYLEKARG